MKIIKIGAVWCGSCLTMKKTWSDIEKIYNLNIISYDYDNDEDKIEKYNVGGILPVSIFLDDNGNEICRLIGNKKKEELIEIIEKYK